MTSIELLRPLELCAGWADETLRAVGALGSERHFEAGSLLLRQGEPAAQAFAIATGQVAVLRTLPGGGEFMLAEKGPGSLVGEMGLLAEQRRSASARAVGSVRTVMFERTVFVAACRMRQPAARALLLRVTERVCQQLRGLVQHLNETLPPAGAVRAAKAAAAPPAFDYRRFLSLLRCAPAFGDAGLAEFANHAQAQALAKGEWLLAPGGAPDGLWLVVHGALETVAGDGASAATLDILGPGSLAGLPGAIDRLPATAGLRAREPTLALHLPQTAFERRLDGQDEFAFGLLHAVAGQLADSLPRLSNRLAQHAGMRRAQAILARGLAADLAI